MKTIGLLRKLRHRGLLKVDWVFIFTGCGLQSGADKKSATSRVSWRPKCVWKRLQTTSGAKKTGISGLISGEAFYFWYGLA
jgi:hypothetical protein